MVKRFCVRFSFLVFEMPFLDSAESTHYFSLTWVGRLQFFWKRKFLIFLLLILMMVIYCDLRYSCNLSVIFWLFSCKPYQFFLFIVTSIHSCFSFFILNSWSLVLACRLKCFVNFGATTIVRNSLLIGVLFRLDLFLLLNCL